ncbi:hypothetical protein O181_124708 [Austropuccinia psidii MF-1]|uniref:CCHC-type domain-containing protein n=1 Tax=Austropuccinia psidii MF-1 TaxID=1389203 RepID=A0A9Q3KP72_9BASI|nr:hypothetical protein [Austropuccinia psidii MF-1]
MEEKVVNLKKPCFHCGEVGHWAPDCPTCKKGAVAWAQSSQRSADMAAIGVIPMLENTEALLDSSATYLVVGNISLLDKVWPANINFSVTSSHQSCVEGIGEL